MAYDDDSPDEQRGPARQSSEKFPTSYQTALAIWVGPALIVGMLMGMLNLQTHDSFISINPDDGEDFMRTELRPACGWPYVLASQSPSSKRWVLSGFGVVVDGIIVLAAMIITAGTTRFVAAIVDEQVSDPIPKQIRRFLRGNPKKVAAKRSARSGRRPKRPADD